MKKNLKEYIDFDAVNKHTTNFHAHTSALRGDEYFAYIQKLDNTPLNYDGCLTFLDIAKKYNDLYVDFMNDYNNLPEKLNVGNELNVLEYCEGRGMIGSVRSARLFVYLNNQVEGNDDSVYLDIFEEGGIVKNVIHNDYRRYVKPNEKIYGSLNLKQEVLKSYLDLFQKHHEFIKMFHNMNKQILADGSWVMINTMNDRDLNITDGLEEFRIHGYIVNNYHFLFDLYFKLGDDFGIDYDKTEIKILDKTIQFSKKDINSLAKNIYVNNYYLIVHSYEKYFLNHLEIANNNVIYRILILREKFNERYGKKFTVDGMTNIIKRLCSTRELVVWANDRRNQGYYTSIQDIAEEYFKMTSDEEIFIQYDNMMKELDEKFEQNLKEFQEGIGRLRKMWNKPHSPKY